jgi:hypothetical protein
MEEVFRTRLAETGAAVEPDHALIVCGSYDSTAGLVSTCFSMFRLKDQWERSGEALYQRCHSQEGVLLALFRTGYEVLAHDVPRESSIQRKYGVGRVFFLALAWEPCGWQAASRSHANRRWFS